MKLGINVKGIDKVINEFSVRGVAAQHRADKVTEAFTRKIANESAEMAPVDTSDLKNSILASPERLYLAEWQFGSRLPYANRQEYEHPSKKGFIRKAVWNNRDEYRKKLREEVANK